MYCFRSNHIFLQNLMSSFLQTLRTNILNKVCWLGNGPCAGWQVVRPHTRPESTWKRRRTRNEKREEGWGRSAVATIGPWRPLEHCRGLQALGSSMSKIRKKDGERGWGREKKGGEDNREATEWQKTSRRGNMFGTEAISHYSSGLFIKMPVHSKAGGPPVASLPSSPPSFLSLPPLSNHARRGLQSLEASAATTDLSIFFRPLFYLFLSFILFYSIFVGILNWTPEPH